MIELSGGKVDKQRKSARVIRELNAITPTYLVISCHKDFMLIADMYRAKMGKQSWIFAL